MDEFKQVVITIAVCFGVSSLVIGGLTVLMVGIVFFFRILGA